MLARVTLTLLTLSGVLAARAGTFFIDGFDAPLQDGPISISSGEGYGVSLDADAYSIRDLTATVQSNTDSSGAERLLAFVGGGSLRYSADSGVDGSLELYYGFDFSGDFAHELSGELESVHLDFGLLDHAAQISFLATGYAPNDGSYREVVGSATALAGTTGFDVPLTSVGGSVVELFSLYLRIDAPSATDFQLSEISITTAPVPEPASMAALGLGAAAMLRRRKKG